MDVVPHESVKPDLTDVEDKVTVSRQSWEEIASAFKNIAILQRMGEANSARDIAAIALSRMREAEHARQ